MAALVLDGTAMVPLGAAAGVVLTIIAMTRKFTKMEDAIEQMQNDICEMKVIIKSRAYNSPGNKENQE
jgi:negative regulator of sigma E activity